MMQSAFELVHLDRLMAKTRGRPEVRIGLIDGVIEAEHPALRGARIESLVAAGQSRCRVSDSVGCQHGTFMAGIFVATGEMGIGGICPEATVISLPVFSDHTPTRSVPSVKPEAVAEAIHRLVDARTDVINLSVGIAAGSLRHVPDVFDACVRAQEKNTLIVAAAGNQSRVGPVWLFSHEWVIPVASCLSDGTIDLRSNLGPSIGRRGLSAPSGIRGAIPPDRVGTMEGSSVATAFVTGTLALLKSIYPQLRAGSLRNAVLLEPRRWRSIVPPLLDAGKSLDYLRSR